MKIGDKVRCIKQYTFDGKNSLLVGATFEIKNVDFSQSVFVIHDIHGRSVWFNNKNEYFEMKEEYENINPNHYKQGGKEVIEMMVDIWGSESVAKYCEMNAFKYRMRVGLKPNQPIQQEIDKALWYENKAKKLKK